jgi:hypothetical protein
MGIIELLRLWCGKDFRKNFVLPRKFSEQISQESVGEIFHMNLSRQYSEPASDGPMGERRTLIELLVIISIIGVLVGR